MSRHCCLYESSSSYPSIIIPFDPTLDSSSAIDSRTNNDSKCPLKQTSHPKLVFSLHRWRWVIWRFTTRTFVTCWGRKQGRSTCGRTPRKAPSRWPDCLKCRPWTRRRWVWAARARASPRGKSPWGLLLPTTALFYVYLPSSILPILYFYNYLPSSYLLLSLTLISTTIFELGDPMNHDLSAPVSTHALKQTNKQTSKRRIAIKIYYFIITIRIRLQVMKLLTKGNRERTMESTAANSTSSRSHALLMVRKYNIIKQDTHRIFGFCVL